MKTIRFTITLFFMMSMLSYASAQCGPTLVEPSAHAIGFCEGTPDTVSFTVTGQCSGNYEYEILTSTNTVVQAWSNSNQFIINTPITDTYTVNARCSTCPTVVATDTFRIEAINIPTIAIDSLVCYNSPTTISASGAAAGSMSWWDSPSNGNQLSSNENYTTPPITANDTFHVHVEGTIQGGTTQGSILITECGLHGFPGSSSADYIEVSNLYATPVNTSGWVVALSSSYSNINGVNNILWNLPSSFTPCSMLYKSDVASQPNYWGNNILWNPNQPGWAAIVDNVGNLVDFVAWGWTAAQLAGFNVMINGFNITLGTAWTGNGCSSACQGPVGTPYSLSRNGNSDNNNATDFVCQASSLNLLNPGLNCGWIASDFTCSYPAILKVDLPPTASAPDTTKVSCYADVPAPSISIITDAADDYTANPTVQYMGETSNGNMCPEILTRTYRVTDSCANYIEVEHIIIINDTVAPLMQAAPADLFIYCYSDLPPMTSLAWTDNCLGAGIAQGIETSSGSTCPEILTRTWTVTDTCGNTATETQIITIFDTIAPIIEAAPANLTIQCPSDLPPMVSLSWTDNCAGAGVLNGIEVSNGKTCPEIITRTWTISDDCGNTSTETQVIIINDDTPPTASNLPTLQLAVLPPADINLITDAADNCGTPLVEWVNDSSDNGFCPENVVRTYSVTDDCGNTTYVTQKFIIGDYAPDVSFTAAPSFLDNLSSGIVQFDNKTTGAVSYSWNFGDYSPLSNEVNPSHEFDISKTRNYNVWLVATSEYGCVDSTKVPIRVFQELIYFIPNAFTPNNDGLNQTFQPIFATGFDPSKFNLKVYNRWGEVLFESYNHAVGWDGTYGGKIVPEGVYGYIIEFGLDHSQEKKVITGSFSLLR